MNGSKILLLLLAIIILIVIILYFLYKIIYIKTIEEFDSGSASPIINFNILMDVNRKTSQEPIIPNNPYTTIGSYFPIYEKYKQEITLGDKIYNYYYDIYSSCVYVYNSRKNIFNLFSTKNLDGYIQFKKYVAENRKYITLKDNTQLSNCISIGATRINANAKVKIPVDAKFYIDRIEIATNITSDFIKFYSTPSSDDISVNYSDGSYFTPLNYNNVSTLSTSNGINVFSFKFIAKDQDNKDFYQILSNIIINFNIDNFNIYYINIYGLTKYEYSLQIEENNKKNAIAFANEIDAEKSASNNLFKGGDFSSMPAEDDQDFNYDSMLDDEVDDNTVFNSENLSKNFLRIIGKGMPWGMYNGPDIANSGGKPVLRELFGREYRNATIIDPNNELANSSKCILKDDTNYSGYDENGILVSNFKSNIEYLKLSSTVNIIFPVGSLPNKNKDYTICAITRYTGGSTGRIITSRIYDDKVNFLVGHWEGRNKVMYNMGWRGGGNKDTGNRTNINDWLVSCVKTGGTVNTNKNFPNNSNYNSILYNGEPYGSESFIRRINIVDNPNDPNYSNYVLTINGLLSEKSDFGLSYLIIWDYAISDEDLDIVSKNLIYAIRDNSYKLPLNNASTNIPNDGLSFFTASKDAMVIKATTKTNANGYYYIKMIDNSNDQLKEIRDKIYCIMDDNVGTTNYGSCWMLAMKGGKGSTLFQFSSGYWKNKLAYNNNYNSINILNDITTDIKTNIFNFYDFNEILIIYNDPSLKNIDGNDYYLRSYYKLQNTDFKGSLAYFFKNDYYDFIYGNVNNNPSKRAFDLIDRSICRDYDNCMFKENGNSKMIYKDYTILNQQLTDREGFNYRSDKFNLQKESKAFGLNLSFNTYHGYSAHRVRIGAAFNENAPPDMRSIDVSGGIGLSRGNIASGNVLGCCEYPRGAGPGTVSYPFLLFVRYKSKDDNSFK